MPYKVSPDMDLSVLTLGETDTVRSVLQNILCILGTRQGTVPMYRDFGLPGRFVDSPTMVARQILLVEVREAILQYEPRAEVVSVALRQSASNPGVVVPEVEVEIHV